MLKPRRSARVLRLSCLALALFALEACSGLKLGADVGYGKFAVSGDLGLGPSTGGPPTGSIDIEDSLGIKDGKGTPYVRVQGAAAVLAFTASGFTFNQNAQGLLKDAFGDIPANTAVNTDTDLTVFKGAVSFDILNVGVVRVSPGLAVDYLDMSFIPSATGISQEVKGQTPVPLLFLQAEANFGPVSAVVDLGGIQANLEQANGSLYDIEALVRFHPTANLHLFGGIRNLIMDADGDQNNQLFTADLRVTGWMAGVGLQF